MVEDQDGSQVGAAPLSPFTNRYEIKYLTKTARLPEIAAGLSEHFALDTTFSQGAGYYVCSVYFDSLDLRFFREKKEGDLVRVKPRLRWYPTFPDEPATEFFLELKGRYDRIVQKRRVPLDREFAERILDDPQAISEPTGFASSVLSEFCYLAHRFCLRPTVTVLYHRQAYIGRLHPRLRMTFDRSLRCSLTTSLSAHSDDFVYTMPPTRSVVELKYNDRISWLLLRKLNALGLVQRTFSKYVHSLERALGEVELV